MTTYLHHDLCATSESLVSVVAAPLCASGCVYAEDEARLLIASLPVLQLEAAIARRTSGEPLEYVLGWAEFLGHRIAIAKGVFVPRRRTEFLASVALDLVEPGQVLLDLCCGSGALATVIATPFLAETHLAVWASDIDPAAVACAARNLAPLGGKVVLGDLFDGLPTALRGRIDLIVANAPYVPTHETELLPREARLYEPLRSYDGGADGFALQRRIASEAHVWLRPGGHLLFETSEAMVPGTQALLEDRGLATRVLRSEDWDATVVLATLPAKHRHGAKT